MGRLSQSLLVLVFVLAAAAAGPSAPRAAIMSTGGPNPNWTEMQKYEWYVGYLAQASRMCGFGSPVLARLARMSPYGAIGLAQYRADKFLGAACARFKDDVAAMEAEAAQIEEHIELTYDCSDDGCYGQDLSDWQFHACGNSLKSHFAILDLDDKDIRAVTMLNPRKTNSKAAHQARVQFHSCQGSLYIDLTEACVMERKVVRGDCEIEGAERF